MPPTPAEALDRWDSVSVSIRHANLYPCQPSWNIPPQAAHYDNLFYIWKGFGWWERDGERMDARPGDLFISRTGHQYAAGHDPARPFTVFSTGFTLKNFGGNDALRDLRLPDRLRLPEDCIRTARALFTDVVTEFHDPSELSRLSSRGSLLRLLAQALRWSRELPEHCRTQPVPALPGEATRVAAIIGYIHENLAKPLTLHALARRAHLSPVYFAGLFRRQTGQPPMAFVRQRRMDLARGLLASSDQTVEQIARAVGFEDPFHFSRVFRRVVGTSPSAYRTSFNNPFKQ